MIFKTWSEKSRQVTTSKTSVFLPPAAQRHSNIMWYPHHLRLPDTSTSCPHAHWLAGADHAFITVLLGAGRISPESHSASETRTRNLVSTWVELHRLETHTRMCGDVNFNCTKWKQTKIHHNFIPDAFISCSQWSSKAWKAKHWYCTNTTKRKADIVWAQPRQALINNVGTQEQ